jgi:hypothetical protein
MNIYTRLQQTAMRLIKDYGEPVQWVSEVVTRNQVTRVVSDAVRTVHTVNSVRADSEKSFIDGSRIEAGRRVYLIAGDTPPAIGWRLAGPEFIVDSVESHPTDWAIVDIKEIKPAETALLYEVQVSK